MTTKFVVQTKAYTNAPHLVMIRTTKRTESYVHLDE